MTEDTQNKLKEAIKEEIIKRFYVDKPISFTITMPEIGFNTTEGKVIVTYKNPDEASK